jgi:hypothetical protein
MYQGPYSTGFLRTSAATHRPPGGGIYRSTREKERGTKFRGSERDRAGDIAVVEVVGFLGRRRWRKK